MKAVIAITAAIAAAATTVAHAGNVIKIDESKVSTEAKAAAKQYVEQSDERNSDENFAVLLSALENGSNSLPLDVKVVLTSSVDSTTARIYNPAVAGGCYSNCYSNCHGSRGWR